MARSAHAYVAARARRFRTHSAAAAEPSEAYSLSTGLCDHAPSVSPITVENAPIKNKNITPFERWAGGWAGEAIAWPCKHRPTLVLECTRPLRKPVPYYHLG
jgi:hypothetical protein